SQSLIEYFRSNSWTRAWRPSPSPSAETDQSWLPTSARAPGRQNPRLRAHPFVARFPTRRISAEGSVRIGILGSGLMGGKLGTIFVRAGHEVVFSYSRNRKTLETLASESGGTASAGTPSDAARGADALLLAVHWSRVDDVLEQAGDLSGKIIVSCSLPMNAD